MIHLQSNNKQQVVTDGNPYLCEDCILGRPIERLDVQVLLDPFEERLDSPALSVQFRNGNCFKGEVIRQESIHYVLRKVLIDDQAQQIRVLLGCKETSKTDGLVRDDTSLPVDHSCLEYGIFHIVLCSGYKVSLLLLEETEQTVKVHITFVHQVVSTCFYRQTVHSLSIMYIARSKHDEVGDIVLNVNQSVHLESALVMMELRPRTELQTQIDGTAVESVYHIVNAQPIEFVFIQDFSPLDKYHCVVLIDTPVLLLVHVGESGLGHHLQAGMIQFGVESRQLSLYATEACAAGQLSITHDKELVTASESSCMKIPSISVNTFPELVVRDERHQLREYSISGIHILCYLIYETVQRYKIKSENFKSAVSH